jgi:transcriptional regulator with XRE-family HTH domain
MAPLNSKPGRFPGQPGAVLRRLRRERLWSLSELSKRTGFPVSTLSKIETGKMSLTYDKLTRISEGLDVDLARIFSENDGQSAPARKSGFEGRRSVTRRNEGGVIDTPSYKHAYHATDLLEKKFVPIVAEIKHRSIEEFDDLIRHEGDEFTFVLEGTVEFHSELYAPTILHPGDSVYFDSRMGHAYVAVGDEPCRVLSICTGHEVHASQEKVRSAAASSSKTEPTKPVVEAGGRAKAKSKRARSRAK